MIGILAEDDSDAEALSIIVRRLSPSTRKIRVRGFGGCAELRRKAASCIRDFQATGCEDIIICHDADRENPLDVERRVQSALKERGLKKSSRRKIIVPIQELEAWIIADELAVQRVLPAIKLAAVSQPEWKQNPKEWLRDQSRKGRSRPLYLHTMHNAAIARHLDLDKVSKKCPSFRTLETFVRRIGR